MVLKCMKISLNDSSEFLFDAISELKAELGITVSNGGLPLTVIKGDIFRVKSNVFGIEIFYTKLAEIFRGLKFVANNNYCEQVFCVKLEQMGVMIDCSRNAVLNISYLKQLIRDMAILGYNQLQLYTEDTYEIPGEKYFGHMRGRYSRQELHLIMNYAKRFGIELVPCVQTLAHLATMFKWNKYESINDTYDILLAENDETYAFLERMIASLRDTFETDVIHIGMDEAMQLGSGKYLHQHGYKDRYEIILKHLNRVVEICKKYNFKPMMWSDMFFRSINNGNYYIEDSSKFEMLQTIIDQVPKEVTLVYWDYYGLDNEHYSKMFAEHKKFNNQIAFAGGSWKWIGYAPNVKHSLFTTINAIKPMEENKISSAFVTCWGDDGAECSTSTIYATLCAYSSYNYTSNYDYDAITSELKSYLGFELEDLLAMDYPNVLDGTYDENKVICPSKYFLYNDPLIGLCDYYAKNEHSDIYLQYGKKLKEIAKKGDRLSYVFDTLSALCYTLSIKATLGLRLKIAYDNDDLKDLKHISECEIKTLLKYFDEFVTAFRHQWEIENKPFGREVLDLRLAGVRERIVVAKDKIERYLNGDICEIEELVPERLPTIFEENENKNSVGLYLFYWIFSPGAML